LILILIYARTMQYFSCSNLIHYKAYLLTGMSGFS